MVCTMYFMGMDMYQFSSNHVKMSKKQQHRKQVASFTKWGFGEKVVLWLMEYLPPILSCHISLDKYFPTFCLLTHLAAKNIRARGVLNKNRLYKYTIIGDKQQQKKGYVVALNITHQARKTVHILQWLVGTATECTSSHSEVFLEKGILKICNKFSG